MIEPFKELGKTLLLLAPEQRSWVFAHLGVPFVLLSLVFFAIGSTAPILDLDSRIAVIPLRSAISGKGSQTKPGLAVILEPHADEIEYRIPWKDGGTHELWTSLDGLDRTNSSRLAIENGELAAKVPFFGDAQPVVIIAPGDPEGHVLVLNKRIPIQQLMLASRRSVALAMWIFVAAVFAAALTSISGWQAPAPAQHSGSKKRTNHKKR